MRTITIKKNIYKYDELSEGAKENVRAWFRDGGSNYYEEIESSIKAICKALGAEIGRTWDDVRADFENVEGTRAYKYIWNSYIYPNRKAKYLRWSDKKHRPMYSRLQCEYSCNFTGVCYDNILWDAWLNWKDDFRHNQKKDVQDFFYILGEVISSEFEAAEQYLYSDEYAAEMCEANNYEFDEFGRIA